MCGYHAAPRGLEKLSMIETGEALCFLISILYAGISIVFGI